MPIESKRIIRFMNELKDKAAHYAAEKTNEIIAKAIAQAYADGYRDGYKECQDKVTVDLSCNNIEFVDLGLPSKTAFSSKFLKDEKGNNCYLPYEKAAEFDIPTKEQIEELFEKCRFQGDFSSSGQSFYGASCIGNNSNYIWIQSAGYKEKDKLVRVPQFGGGNAYFWIRDNADGDEKCAVRLYYEKNGKPEYEFVKVFTGFKLPVLVTRKS